MQCVITCTFWVYTEVLLCICVIFFKKKKKEKGAVKQSTLKKKSLVLKNRQNCMKLVLDIVVGGVCFTLSKPLPILPSSLLEPT